MKAYLLGKILASDVTACKATERTKVPSCLLIFPRLP